MRRIGTLLVAGFVALLCSGCGLYGWGNNDIGQIGDGTLTTPRVDPTPSALNANWIAVDAGRFHACGIDTDHELFCWGDDLGGEIGDGAANPTVPRTSPTRVGTATDWSVISAGGFGGAFPLSEAPDPGHTCGIRAGGALYCWGLNSNGQLGDGTQTSRSTPTPVGSATDWSRVSAGGFHSCGIRSGGALYCWGDNTRGQLGDGTTNSSTVPVRVGTASDWTFISAGFSAHTCGIRAGGALYCWGDNNDGEIGDSTAISRLVPTRVGADIGWTRVSAGGTGTYADGLDVVVGYTCGIRSRALYCWGANDRGQLGDGTIINRSTPTHITDVDNWSDISLGAFRTCGIRSGGSLFCWGANLLGDGNTIGSTTPVQAKLGRWVAVSNGRGHTEALQG